MTRARLSFAEHVRALRISSGLTQAELAERAGISERAVSDVERGLRTSVYAATARRLADALSVSGDNRPAFLLAASRDPSRQRLPDAAASGLPFRYRSRLPLPLTRLIGRDVDLAGVRRLLGADAGRLVTIVGPGGVGKTRLAIEAAQQISTDTGRAVYFVDLAAIDDPASVLASVAASVGMPLLAGDLLSRLPSWLGENASLLLLDTMEHVIDAAPAVAELVAACPDLSVLVTSRSPLRVRGERQWPLAPLSADGPAADDATSSPAVELFFERARDVVPTLSVDRKGRHIAGAICVRLDGLPLAIELAAARVKHMSLPALLRSLDEGLAPLAGGHRDAPVRHRTMRAAIDWSYALLGDTEQRVLRTLAVFRGGCTADALASVLTDRHVRPLDAVGTLIEASLVIVDDATSEARYRLLDMVSAYALEQAIAVGERDALQRSHGDYFLALAQRAEPHLRGSDQREWLTRLLADEGNLRAAMTWALDNAETVTALHLAGALWMFWRWAGLFDDARVWLEAALRADVETSAARLPVLWGAGWLAFHQGDVQRTLEVGSEMLLLTKSTGDRLHRRNALTLMVIAAQAMGRDDDAVATAREALALCDETTDRWVLATSLLNLATALSAAGLLDEAMVVCQQAIDIYEEIGDRHFAARAQLQLGYAALRRDDRPAAARRIGSAFEVIRDLGDIWSIAEGLEAVSALRAEERPQDAAMLAGAAEGARELIAMHAHPADARVNAQRLEVARELLGEAFETAYRRGREAPLESMVALAGDG